ncbi:hypothetical protein FB451DRAFT_1368357 [Mycena latifolia]|nr:hypothetical protein FB451DRAFT_1368357 [Mycena latifolia]
MSDCQTAPGALVETSFVTGKGDQRGRMKTSHDRISSSAGIKFVISKRLSFASPSAAPSTCRILLAPEVSLESRMETDDEGPCAPLNIGAPHLLENYPPDIPVEDPELLIRAFRRPKSLEWLGDALIEAALYNCLCHLIPDCSTPINNPLQAVVEMLGSKPFLAGMAFLYGFHLHPDFHLWIPRMKTMCNVFECVVGATAQHSGAAVVNTLGWLDLLLGPWVHHFLGNGSLIPCAVTSGRTEKTYNARLRGLAGTPPSHLEPLSLKLAGEQVMLPAVDRAQVGPVLASKRRGWQELDISRVSFPDVYPQTVPSNERYRALGVHMCKLALTLLALEKFPEGTAADLNDICEECMNPQLLARFSLLYHLDSHLRVLRPEGTQSWRVTAQESASWNPVMPWLNMLLSPWLVAVQAGAFKVRTGVQKMWSVRLEQQTPGLIAGMKRTRERDGQECCLSDHFFNQEDFDPDADPELAAIDDGSPGTL